MSDLRGLDKEIHERMQSKYDPALEQKALDWIAAITGTPAPKVIGKDSAALFTYLKKGVVLCRLLNRISPGVIPEKKIADPPKNMLEERNNIQLYLAGCKRLSIPSQDTFVLSDLHSAKSMGAVLQNIYALGRQAQVISSFKGPILGVKYNVSIAEQQRRLKKKEQERLQRMERVRAISDTQLVRRKELETLKREEIIKEMETNDIRKLHRQYSRGSINAATFHKLAYASDERFKELRTSDVDLVSNSDIKFGVDIELHEKRKKSYSLKREEQAMDWIETVTGEEVDDFYEGLKSDVVLCTLINAVYPDIVKKIGTKDLPLVHRDNIQQYLNACRRIGLNPSQSFNVSDLYEKKDLDAVINNIFALGRKAEFAPQFKGPAMNVNGTISPLPEPELDRQACRCFIM